MVLWADDDENNALFDEIIARRLLAIFIMLVIVSRTRTEIAYTDRAPTSAGQPEASSLQLFPNS